MKALTLNKILRDLTLSDKFTKKGRLAYYIVTHRTGAMVLVGLYLDKSIDSTSFIDYYFAQCLYDPFCALNFSLGDRIGSYWDIDSIPDLQEKINKFDLFNKLNTFDDFVYFLNSHPFYGDRLAHDNYMALTYFILEQYDKSLLYLNKIILMEKDVDLKSCSQEVKNARFIKNAINNCKYNEGLLQIIKWQNQTIKDIGLIIK